MVYDIAFLGHYTKDTIVSAEGTRVVDGGAFNYGSHAAARMGGVLKFPSNPGGFPEESP